MRRWIPPIAAFLVVFAYGVWAISPRFSIGGPYVVDDWWSIQTAPHALRELLAFGYDPIGAGDPKRYRPGFTAVWNSLVWHTFPVRTGMFGPNLWNLVRLAVFCAASVGVTWSLVRSAARGAINCWWAATLAAVPGLLVLGTGAFDLEFARLGPTEPLAIACVLAGGAILADVLRRWLSLTREPRKVSVPWLVAEGIAGTLLWLFGIFTKELSVTLFVALPFVILSLAGGWRESGVLQDSWRRRETLVVAAIVLIPLLFMSYWVLTLAGEGTTVYGKATPHGLGGWLDRLGSSFDRGWNLEIFYLSNNRWNILATGLPFVVVAAAFRRRSTAWLGLGLMFWAAAAFVFQGMGGAWDVRYYLPSVLLIGVAATACIATQKRWTHVALIASCLVLVVTTGTDGRDRVVDYADRVNDYVAAVDHAAALDPARCPVYIANMPIEMAEAFGVLTEIRRSDRPLPCDKSAAGLMVQARQATAFAATNQAIDRVCATGWQDVRTLAVIKVRRCERFRDGRLASGEFIADVLRWDRLDPGTRISRRLRGAGPFCRADSCRELIERVKIQ